MHKNTLQIKSIIIIGFVIIGYMLFNLAVSVYKDYQVNLRLKRYGEEKLRIARSVTETTQDFTISSMASVSSLAF